jgi:hypothetical protein
MRERKLTACLLTGAAISLIAGLFATPAAADDTVPESECPFVVKHGRNLVLERAGVKEGIPLVKGKTSDPVVLRPGRDSLCVEMTGHDTVFFRYSWSQGAVTESENYQAAVGLAKSLDSLVGSLKSLADLESERDAGARGKAAVQGYGVDPGKSFRFGSLRAAGGDHAKAVAEKRSHELLNDAALQRRSRINTALADAGIPNGAAFITASVEQIEQLSKSLSKMESTIRRLAKGEKVKPSEFPGSEELEEERKALLGQYAKLDKGQAALLSLVPTDAGGIAEEPFYVGSTLLQSRRVELIEGARKLVAFAKQLQEMASPLRLGDVLYKIKDDQIWILKIERIDANTPESGKRPDKPEGEFAIRFVPYSPVKLGLGAAAIYSFVSDAKYTTQPVDGGFQIVESPDQKQYQEGGIAAVLTITPRGWTDPTFGGFFEVGVQPTDDLGLIAGAGIRLFDIASFGAGIAFQQVDVLSPGLSLGDTVAAESDLKTAKRFKAGVYLHITLSIDVKK